MAEYKKNPVEEIDEEERKRREVEMEEAMRRLEVVHKRRKITYVSALIGLMVGLLYVFWLIFAMTTPSGGVTVYERYLSLLPLPALLMDFVPPVALDIILTCIFSRGVSKKPYYCVTALMVTVIVITIFMVYTSYSGLISG